MGIRTTNNGLDVLIASRSMVPNQCFANNVPPYCKNRYLCTAEFLNCVAGYPCLTQWPRCTDTPALYKTAPGVSRHGIGRKLLFPSVLHEMVPLKAYRQINQEITDATDALYAVYIYIYIYTVYTSFCTVIYTCA